MDALMNWIDKTFGSDATLEAWQEFVLWDERAIHIDLETPHRQLFWPWFYHAWHPGVLTESDIDPNPDPGRSMVRCFLDDGAPGCNTWLRRYLEACSVTPFNFYEVLSDSDEDGFTLRDLVTGRHTLNVHRKHPYPKAIQTSDILYGLCVQVDDIAQLEACAPVTISPSFRSGLIERCMLPINIESVDTQLMCRHDLKLRAIYFDVAGSALLAKAFATEEEQRIAS